MQADRGIFVSVKTPVFDFVSEYINKNTTRFHMPGHKGNCDHLGVEIRDITEIKGADYLFEADGVIGESEAICSSLFETAKTLYSTEGSSLSIKTMVALCVMNRKDKSQKGTIVAPRNCHKAFVNGCVLADADVEWVYPVEKSYSITQSLFTAEDIRLGLLKAQNPCGVYITSPDYLGNIADISKIKKVCEEFSVPLMVDNAHGAYLKFLETDSHPITLGADMCCDSAHKTLPVLTGGGYLHISKTADSFFVKNAKTVMSMYASTSPSFLTLQSLDLCNKTLSGDFKANLSETIKKTSQLCEDINGFMVEAHTFEPLKISVFPNNVGYTGNELADFLRENNIEPEYSDENAVVLMLSPYNKDEDFRRCKEAFSKLLHKRIFVRCEEISLSPLKKAMSLREGAFSDFETVEVSKSEGRICALTVTSCQPSIPVVVSGEVIDENIIKILKRYSIFEVNVVK